MWMIAASSTPFSAPVAWFAFARCTAWASWSMPMPRAASAAGSAWIRTAYFAAPNTLTCATPFNVDSWRASSVSA